MANKKVDKVSSDVVYSELYNESRRYRDYELTVSTWYTAILLSFLGFYVSEKINSNPTIINYSIITPLILVLSSVLGLSSIYSVWFVHRRNSQIRKLMNKFESD